MREPSIGPLSPRLALVHRALTPPVAMAAAVLLLTHLIPRFEPLYAGLGVAPPLLAATAMRLGAWMSGNPVLAWGLALGVGAGLGAIYATAPLFVRIPVAVLSALPFALVAAAAVQSYAFILGHGP